jgi:hypothetical protein
VKPPKRRRRPTSAPPNLAARSLRTPAFRVRVPPNPKAYRRKGRLTPTIVTEEPED